MGSYLFTSHDGFGLGHVRRNMLVAEALRREDPVARIVVVTGVPNDLPWLRRTGIEVVRVPSLVKDADGRYTNDALGRQAALDRRASVFAALVDSVRPDAVVVDRHPFGIDGELRPGLERCRQLGTAVVLGLRDILDEAPVVRAEIDGAGWDGVDASYDQVVVYGARHVCDHQAEYGLAYAPAYVGWVTERPTSAQATATTIDERLLVVAAGGGGDGAHVRRVGRELVLANDEWRAVMVAGPLARDLRLTGARELAGRLELVVTADGCRDLLATAGASVQMAGYNTTVEALAAGLRPILVPRRSPRREQAIRAARLASLGLADVVDDDADVGELSWLLRRPRRLGTGELARAGIDLDGARQAATLVRALAGARRSPMVGAR